ncbi:MAG: amidohydrolase family protein, partial [Phycisphaerae bacterium]
MTDVRAYSRHVRTACGAFLNLVILLVCSTAALTVPAYAEEPVPTPPPESQPTTQPDSQPTTTSTTTTTTSSETEKEEKKDEYLAILNGRVVTVSGPVLQKASVLCKNGKIVEIADSIVVPAECTVIDAAGKWIYPGLVAASAGGIHGGGKPDDTTDVFSLNMTVALAGGITSAIAGNDAAKLTYGTTDGMIIDRNVFLDINRNWRGATAYAEFRADLQKVRAYLRDLAKHKIDKEDDKEAKPPEKDWLKGKYEQYLKLLNREVTAVASANQSQELIRLAELAEEFDFRLVIRGGYEAWIVPSALARADVGIILTPRTIIEADERQNRNTGSSIETAKILADHGITVAIVPATSRIGFSGLAGRDLLHLNMEAAFAVRGGMTNEQAVRAITLDAARILGVDKRVGSIEVGKDADLIV